MEGVTSLVYGVPVTPLAPGVVAVGFAVGFGVMSFDVYTKE